MQHFPVTVQRFPDNKATKPWQQCNVSLADPADSAVSTVSVYCPARPRAVSLRRATFPWQTRPDRVAGSVELRHASPPVPVTGIRFLVTSVHIATKPWHPALLFRFTTTLPCRFSGSGAAFHGFLRCNWDSAVGFATIPCQPGRAVARVLSLLARCRPCSVVTVCALTRKRTAIPGSADKETVSC